MAFLSISCTTVPKHEGAGGSADMADNIEEINIKYPVILIHGAGFRDKILGFINYWGRIPDYLSEHGVRVHYSGADGWGSIEYNGETIRNKIIDVLRENNAEKVNIIAHSRGGLEARYLISTLKMDYAVASLTTISTPHHGVKAMNTAVKTPDGLYKFISFFVNRWFKILGDKNPDYFTSSRQLSEIYVVEFNKQNPDNEHVYYQSYAAKMKYFFSDFNFIIMNPLIQMTDGDNDGLCPVDSAKWGDFKGIVTTQGVFGISHAGIIDTYRVKYKGVDILNFYFGIVKELSERGL
jgi:triacylglycerol lipase